MGIETEHFMDGDGISSQLLCAICQCVVDPPVSTPCDHLFCEDCLISWLERRESGNETCPMCNTVIDPVKVEKPSRIIINLLGEMRRYCENRSEGCPWVSACDEYEAHSRTCGYVPTAKLLEKVAERDARVAELTRNLRDREVEVARLRQRLEHCELTTLENQALHEQLQVYEDIHNSGGHHGCGDSRGEYSGVGRCIRSPFMVLQGYSAYKDKFGTHCWEADKRAQSKGLSPDDHGCGNGGGGHDRRPRRLHDFRGQWSRSSSPGRHSSGISSFVSFNGPGTGDWSHSASEDHQRRGGGGGGGGCGHVTDLNDVQRIRILRHAQARLEQAEGHLRDKLDNEEDEGSDYGLGVGSCTSGSGGGGRGRGGRRAAEEPDSRRHHAAESKHGKESSPSLSRSSGQPIMSL